MGNEDFQGIENQNIGQKTNKTKKHEESWEWWDDLTTADKTKIKIGLMLWRAGKWLEQIKNKFWVR